MTVPQPALGQVIRPESVTTAPPPAAGPSTAIAVASNSVPPRARYIAELAVLLVMVSWAANVVAVKAAIADVPPILFAFLRFAGAFLALLAFLRWREGSVGLPRADIVPIALLGLVGFGIYQDLFVSALSQTTAANSALITAATPVSTMLIAAAIGSDTLSRPKLVGAAIALSGALGVVAATHGFSFSGASAGDMLTFVATICWSCYVAFGAPILRRHSPLRTATWAIGFGCLGMLPFAAAQLPALEPARIGPGIVALFLFCALLPAAAANVVLFSAIKLLGPTRVMLFQFLVPAFAVVLAAIFLNEAIVVGQIIGGLVIVAGILVATQGARTIRQL